jgi:hypothetical protein
LSPACTAIDVPVGARHVVLTELSGSVGGVDGTVPGGGGVGVVVGDVILMLAVPVMPADDAATVALPTPRALTQPVCDTLARAVPLVTDHVNVAATGCPLELYAVGVRRTLSPLTSMFVAGETLIEVTVGLGVVVGDVTLMLDVPVMPAEDAATVAVPISSPLTHPVCDTLTRAAPLGTDHVKTAATG